MRGALRIRVQTITGRKAQGPVTEVARKGGDLTGVAGRVRMSQCTGTACAAPVNGVRRVAGVGVSGPIRPLVPWGLIGSTGRKVDRAAGATLARKSASG